MTDKNNNKEAYSETFFIIPAYILDLPGMTLGYLKVYWTFFQFWNKRLPCFLSNPAIASKTNLKPTQVKAALTYFEENGELIRENRGNKRYLIKPDKPIAWVDTDGGATPPSSSSINQQVAPPTSSAKVTQVVAPAAGGGRSTDHEVVAPPTTEYKEENIKKLITTSDKKEEVINQSSFFSDMQTERVLRIRLETKCLPEFSINEFLKICETHVKTDTPKNLNFNKAQRLAGLCKMIAMGEFEPPVSYTVTKKKQKESVIQNRIAEYNEYAGRIKSDINLKLVPANTKIKNYEEWVNG